MAVSEDIQVFDFDVQSDLKKESQIPHPKLDSTLMCEDGRVMPDIALPEVVHNNLYQMLVMVLLCLSQTWVGLETIGANFLAPRQDHWCFIPELQNMSVEARREMAIPYDVTSGGFSQCEMYNITFADAGNDIFIDNSSTTACDTGYEYSYIDYGVTVTNEVGMQVLSINSRLIS